MNTNKKNMLKLVLLLGFVLAGLLPLTVTAQNSLDKAKVVAQKSGNLTVCKLNSLEGGELTISLSAITGELQILKLDPASAALVKNSATVISEHYVLVSAESGQPCKLFSRKDGRFIGNVGAIGQGPGEYRLIYDQQIDEAAGHIYLLPWQSKNLLVYDLKGKFQRAIPLCYPSPKGRFWADSKTGKLIVSVLPFTGAKALVWQQTFGGKLLKSVAPGSLSITPDFSNELSAFPSAEGYDFTVFTFAPRKDTLYRYNTERNVLIPLFTLDFGDRTPSIHGYAEYGNYYMGDISEPKKLNAKETTTQNTRFYLVDKRTCRGGFFHLVNDYLGNMAVPYPTYSFRNGYFVQNMDPGDLADALDKALATGKLSQAQREKLTRLKDGISENDNNYILYAPIKR
ncbi:MAG: 6-bladed beta-propeller [Tannerella sp.]|jgi:hypothetical protein|nr:6-bladed beta-propeller [Tannerella sp.]